MCLCIRLEMYRVARQDGKLLEEFAVVGSVFRNLHGANSIPMYGCEGYGFSGSLDGVNGPLLLSKLGDPIANRRQ